MSSQISLLQPLLALVLVVGMIYGVFLLIRWSRQRLPGYAMFRRSFTVLGYLPLTGAQASVHLIGHAHRRYVVLLSTRGVLLLDHYEVAADDEADPELSPTPRMASKMQAGFQDTLRALKPKPTRRARAQPSQQADAPRD